MVGFPFPFWYKTATSRTASAARKSRCGGMVWMRLWLQKRSPLWAVQVLRLCHQVLFWQGSPKVNARTVAGRKHSQLTNIPEDSTRLWGLRPWLAVLEDPWAAHWPRPAACEQPVHLLWRLGLGIYLFLIGNPPFPCGQHVIEWVPTDACSGEERKVGCECSKAWMPRPTTRQAHTKQAAGVGLGWPG